jgi:hypothetical protein
MKYFMAILLAISAASCSVNKNVGFSYSGTFKALFPLGELSGATIFTADALSFKTIDGDVISGSILYREVDNIPMDFDMRSYPEIIFGFKEYTGSSKALMEKFSNTRMAFEHSYSLTNVSAENNNGVTRYSTCKNKSCLGFVVKNSFSDHILMVFSEGLAKEDFVKLINGAFYVR